MDSIEVCIEAIKRQLEHLDKSVEVPDSSKNLDKILHQQDDIKVIIERDGYIKSLKKSIAEDGRFIENIRKSCTKVHQNALRDRQELFESQSKELEKFQMQQLKSINGDYYRHKEILETRKREILALKNETENEDKNRESYLADVEKNLEKQLRNRQQSFEHSRSKDVML